MDDDHIKDVTRTQGEPHDRLTRICDFVTQAFDAHPEHQDGDCCVVFLSDQERGGLVIHGYEDDVQALADVFGHLQAIFKAQGAHLEILTIPDDVGDLG